MKVTWMPKDDSDRDLFAEEFAIDPNGSGNGYFVNNNYVLTKYQWNGFSWET